MSHYTAKELKWIRGEKNVAVNFLDGGWMVAYEKYEHTSVSSMNGAQRKTAATRIDS